MMRAGRNRFHARQTRNLERAETVLAFSIAELAIIIVAPRPDGAILLQGERMSQRGGDRRDVGNSNYLGGRGGGILGPVAEPPAPVVTPGPDRAVAFQGKAMSIAGDHRRDVGKLLDLLGFGK